MSYDVVVVGAGSAGAVLAARLSEDPGRSVLLLEAGPDYPDFETLPTELKFGYGTGTDITTRSHNWTYAGQASAHGPELVVPRGRVTGGTSAINGQVFRRGVPEDFDAWAAAGNDGWSFADVLPYFCAIETDLDVQDEFHGTTGPIPVSRISGLLWQPAHRAFFDACRSLGYPEDVDQNHPGGTGVGGRPFNNLGGLRMSTALCYLAPARARPNLTVWPNSLARRVVTDGHRARAVEVERDGEQLQVAAGEIVVSAGTIGSPQLLLLSGIGPAEQLRRVGVPVVLDLPGVGQSLRDHPLATLEYRAGDSVGHLDWAPRMPVDLRCTAPGSAARNDVQIVPRVLPAERPDGHRDPADLRVRLTAALQLEDGAGRLTLVSADPGVAPMLNFDLLTEESDRRRLRDSIRICAAIAATDEFKPIVDRPVPVNLDPADLDDDRRLDAWIARNVGVEQHATSTCRMGPAADPAAVVDAAGRVHGIAGLRVADASIMPNCVRANTNATTVMLAEQLADRIGQAS